MTHLHRVPATFAQVVQPECNSGGFKHVCDASLVVAVVLAVEIGRTVGVESVWSHRREG